MSNPIMTEEEVLQRLNIPDFRHLTKDKVISFASMLEKMDPELAKKVIDKFPDYAKAVLSALQNCKDTIVRLSDSNDKSLSRIYDECDQVVESLSKCLEDGDVSFEEKKYFIEQMMKITESTAKKDAESKAYNWKMFTVLCTTVIVAIGTMASIIGGNTSINIPNAQN
jgi:hypothetical protein